MATAAMEAGVASERGAPWRWAASRLPRWWPYALIALVTLLIRLPTIGNPILDFDEQLYLLVGDGMWHGQLPYVDMWDRKPLGLFALYAMIRGLGGAGIVEYQLSALGFVVLTAWIVRAMVRRVANEIAAVVAAIGYVLMLNILHGAGGQTAVFYNALTAFAAWCAFKANDALSVRRLMTLAMPAMLALGLAIQIKYTVVAEGIFLGCWFAWRFLAIGAHLRVLVGAVVAMVTVALLPTLLALAFYAAVGHLPEFVFANFVSIFQRHSFAVKVRHDQMSEVAARCAALMAVALLGLYQFRPRLSGGRHLDFWLLAGWLTSALAGFAMLGDFYDFYFLPVVLPASVAGALAIKGDRQRFAVVCVMLLWPLVFVPPNYFLRNQGIRQTDRMVTTIAPLVRNDCLYVYDGPSILYFKTQACRFSRFVFPDHLTNPVEADALGASPVAEEQRILAARPGAIVTASRSVVPQVAPATQALVRAALARDYVLVDRVPTIDRTYFIWARRDLHPGPAPIHDPRADNPQ